MPGADEVAANLEQEVLDAVGPDQPGGPIGRPSLHVAGDVQDAVGPHGAERAAGVLRPRRALVEHLPQQPADLVLGDLAAGVPAHLAARAGLALDLDARGSLADVAAPARRVAVAIGPEGGFGASDWRRLDAAGFARVGLGPRVLRAETAAIAVCAVAQSLWGDL